jgi:3-oxoadipate enol-lactonase/4-carboxymuconolactone decarboxylase
MTVPTLRCLVLPVRSGAPDARLVVLGPSLGTTSEIWDAVADGLAQDYRVLRFDLPGHGLSPSATESFDMADLAAAVIELVDSVGGGAFYYAGDSMGSAVGLTIALKYPGRVRRIAAFAAPAVYGSPESWAERAAQVRASGTASVVSSSASRWFAPGFLEREPALGAAALDHLVQVDDESYALCCEALAGYDLTADAPSLAVPAVFVAGEFDVATAPAAVKALAGLVTGARYQLMSGVGHLPVLEDPVVAEQVIRSVLPPVGASSDLYESGMRVRREILGDRHVDEANESITAETADFQEFLTRYAWGEVWDRPGLGRRDRSLVTLASLITGGHDNELAMHIRAGLLNGLTRTAISETIMHTALYAGLPAANSAFAIARDVFAELDAETTQKPRKSKQTDG